MKFVMTLVLAATFATPAFASEKESKTASEKNRTQIKTVIEKAKTDKKAEEQGLNEEEKKGAKAYRLEDIKDPNEMKVSTEKSWTVAPWFGDNRKRILTPPEYQREQEEGKYSTYAGSEVGKNYKTVFGAKVKLKLGSKQ